MQCRDVAGTFLEGEVSELGEEHTLCVWEGAPATRHRERPKEHSACLQTEWEVPPTRVAGAEEALSRSNAIALVFASVAVSAEFT